MTISDEVVEAATSALVEAWGYGTRQAKGLSADLRIVLEAAAPFIRAQALEDAADDPELRLSGHSGISITRLRARARDIREGAIREGDNNE